MNNLIDLVLQMLKLGLVTRTGKGKNKGIGRAKTMEKWGNEKERKWTVRRKMGKWGKEKQTGKGKQKEKKNQEKKENFKKNQEKRRQEKKRCNKKWKVKRKGM